MRKILFNRWNIISFLFICIILAIFLFSGGTSFFKQYNTTSDLSYYLLNSQNKRLQTSSFTIKNDDLILNTYTNPIYLLNQRSSSYLRIFVTVSKQKNNEIYSLNEFDNSQLPYTLTYSGWTNGKAVTDGTDYDDDIALELGHHWRYYNQTVHRSKVEIFNSIYFEDGIEEDYEFVVTITIDIQEKTSFNSTTMWLDKPATWLNQVL